MNIVLWITLFILSLAGLLWTSKVFIQSSEGIAKNLKWSPFFTGLILVAVGTSLPELTTSLWASGKHLTTLVASNVVGSNITNVLLIVGLTAVGVKEIHFKKDTIHAQIGFLLCSTFLFIVSIYDGRFTWVEGIIMLILYINYIGYNIKERKDSAEKEVKKWIEPLPVNRNTTLLFLLSGTGVCFASFLTIQSLQALTSLLNVLPSILGASALALGTSLPELVTTLIAARQGNTDLAIGNIIGSNILNTSLVMSLPSFLSPLTISSDVITLGIPFLLMATLLLSFALVQKKISIYEGTAYILLYLVFNKQLFTAF